jgi:hypothetical protein
MVILAASLAVILLAARRLDPERLLAGTPEQGRGLLARLRALLGRSESN